jgi:hypothetical protein
MIRSVLFCIILISIIYSGKAQTSIPIDTLHWDINAQSYILEPYKGQMAIYLQRGSMELKNTKFLNGTIEYDIYLKDTQAFPGVNFRVAEPDAEEFYLRPHLSGKEDANQAVPVTMGISPWQLYFGPKYSFPYTYHFDDWTHVKLVVNGDRAQVFLDHSSKPQLSWKLFHKAREGGIVFTGGGNEALHLANISVTQDSTLTDFNPIERKPIEGLVPEWAVSDKFEEDLLNEPSGIPAVINARKWGKKVVLEEGVAANISREVQLYDDKPGNTVFARITIQSDKDQTRLFEFGYSDRVVALLNGTPIYRGNNNYRSRDYRYLGTIGLFDAIYLPLKKGDNTLLMAVSEDFGGWLITGRFTDPSGLKIK